MKIVEKTTHFDLHVVVVSNDTLLPMKVIVCVEQYIFLQFYDLKAILFKIQMTLHMQASRYLQVSEEKLSPILPQHLQLELSFTPPENWTSTKKQQSIK